MPEERLFILRYRYVGQSPQAKRLRSESDTAPCDRRGQKASGHAIASNQSLRKQRALTIAPARKVNY